MSPSETETQTETERQCQRSCLEQPDLFFIQEQKPRVRLRGHRQ